MVELVLRPRRLGVGLNVFVEAAEPPPVDCGRVLIYWVLEGLAAIFTVALLAVLVPLALSANSTQVDPATVPAGRPYVVITNSTGPAAYYTCPSVREWFSSDQDRFCADAMSAAVTGLVLAAVGAMATAFLFFWLRRLRLREKYRAATWTAPDHPPVEYRQSGMPTAFWLAFILVGLLELLMIAGTIIDLWAGKPLTIIGPLFFGLILYLIGWVHGLKRAYRVQLVDTTVVWTAPLRARRAPLAHVVGVEVPERGTMIEPERIGRIRLSDGGALDVNLPDDYRRWQFSGFAETLRGQGVPVSRASD